MAANWWEGDPVAEKAPPAGRDAASVEYLAETDRQLGLSPGTSERQIAQESNFDDNAESAKHARGAAQVIPRTLRAISARVGRDLDPTDRDDALLIHREVMRENMAHFGNEQDALRAYNAGWDPSKWDNPETNDYVQRITSDKASDDGAWWRGDEVVDKASRDLPAGVAPSQGRSAQGHPWNSESAPPEPVLGYARRLGGRGAKPTTSVPAEPTPVEPGGSVLDRPYPPFQSPRIGDEEYAQLDAMSQRPAEPTPPSPGSIQNSPPEVVAGNVIRQATGSGGAGAAVQGAAAGFAGLGQALPGLVAAGADLVGAKDVSEFALGAAQRAENFSQAVTPQGGYYNKLIANVFSSTVQSLPTLAFGVAGGAEVVGGRAVADLAAKKAMDNAMRELFVQSASQKYADLRNKGFEPLPSAAASAIEGAAEVLGERFGFHEQMAVIKAALGKRVIPPAQLGHVMVTEILKQIPGEELTTAIETINDKYGFAATSPQTTLEDYFQAAVDTAVQTVGQTALMSAPATIRHGVGSAYRSADAAIAYDQARLNGFHVEPPLTTDSPDKQRNKTLGIFEGLAALYGIPKAAVERAKEAVDGMALADVGPFLKRFVGALQTRNLTGARIDPQMTDTLDAGPIEPPPDETKAPKGETTAPAAASAAPAAPTSATTAQGAAVDNIAAALGTKAPTVAPTAEPTVDEAAHEAATSPTNERPEPTPEQVNAGNYKLGHYTIGGLPVSIENDEGSTRRSKPDAPVAWETTMTGAHYGYIRGTVAMDGHKIDTFIKPSTPRDFDGTAFVIDQVDPATGQPDEHKVMLGYGSEAEARKAYLANYQKGWKGLGAITATPMADLKTWLAGDTSRPFAKAAAPAAPPTPAATPPAAPVVTPAGGRVVARVGHTPKAATPLELRANKDGTHTPWLDGHEVLDFESGKPVVVPADATNQQVVDAVKQAGSLGRHAKFYDIEKDPEQLTPKTALAGFAKGISDALYDGLYQALAAGKTTHAGIKDPVLAKARPAFDAGLIKSAEDLRAHVAAGYPSPATTVSEDSSKLPDDVLNALNGKTGRPLHDAEDELPQQPSEPHAAWWQAASREDRLAVVEKAGLPKLAATTTDWNVFSDDARAKLIAARGQKVMPEPATAPPAADVPVSDVKADERDWSKATPDELDAEIGRLDAESARLRSEQRKMPLDSDERAQAIRAMDEADRRRRELVELLPEEPEPEPEPDEPYAPPANWRESMYYARTYARSLGIDPAGMELPALLKAIDKKVPPATVLGLFNKMRRFASGMSRVGDLGNGARAVGGLDLGGIGTDVGELSANAIETLANAVIHQHTAVFVDSGAFSAFRRGLKAGIVEPMDFEPILAKYDAILAAIAQANPHETTDYVRPMFVMPDVVGDQAASLALVERYKLWVGTEAAANLMRPVVPIQKGTLTMAQAYAQVVKTLGTDRFIVGIPSNEKAVTPEELTEFLREARPKAIHILGAAAQSKLLPRLQSAIDAGLAGKIEITADASPIRSKILQAVEAGAKRGETIAETLFNPNDPKVRRDARNAAREIERSTYRELVANPALVGKSLDDIIAAVKAKLGAAGEGLKVPLLARAIHKQLAKNAAELAKQAHRHPEIRAAALAEAVTAAFPDAGVAPERHTALIGGFDHALAGKTKSTLSGEHLADMLSGYEAAKAWMQTEQGAAWYEGRPVNKLQNTGIDLRRWYEALQAQMKAGESDADKAWAQIERATSRADLFAPLLPEGVTPGFRLYVEHLRGHTATFKEYLDTLRMHGQSFYRSSYDNIDPNYKLLLAGERWPSNLSPEDQDKFKADPSYRIQWMQDAAADYVRAVREFIDFAQGKSSVKEAAQKFSDLYIESAPKDGRAVVTQAGKALVYGEPHVFDGRAGDFTNLRVDSAWTETLIEQETTIALPDKTTPLVPPRMDRVTRDGADLRGGQSVTPQQVKDRFAFADVGFGTWVGAKQDQDHLNYAHDAFSDLAKHFGVPLNGIGFGGKMHFTIGALGHGKYAAHFATGQPSPIGPVEVINLTNTKGDGTVYHEWVHALDQFLGGEWHGVGATSRSGVRQRLLRYLTRGVPTVAEIEKRADDFLFGGSYWTGDKRGSKQAAARQVMHRYYEGHHTAYKSNADKLGKDYWGNEKELIARAGEAWAADTLGHTNTYLVNPEWVGDGKVTKDKGYRGTPYPSGTERAQFNLVYTALAKSVKWADGKPTITLADFEANLPEALTAGEKRRIELQDTDAMQAYFEQASARRADAAAERAQAEADQKRREQAEMDALAEAKLKDLEPPAPPPAPPIVDGPSVSDTQGPLSESDVRALIAEVSAELREEGANEPDAPPPGEPAAPPVAGSPAAPPTESSWQIADLQEMLDRANNGDMVATAEKIAFQVPTIHELGRMGETRHMGDGFFETTGRDADGKAWSMTWDGGGAMHKTASGRGWTNVNLTGNTPYPGGVKHAIKSEIDRLVDARRPPPAPPAPPAGPAAPAPSPGAAALIAEAAKLGVSGVGDIFNGLDALFGPPGTVRSFPGGIDEETYKKAKVHFKAALVKFQAAGQTLRELFRMLIAQYGEGITEYLVRFQQEEGLTAQLGSKPTAAMQIADKVKARLSMGHSFDWRVLFAWADEAHGGTQAAGKYTPKDAYDAMEAGVNRYILAHPDLYSPAVTREDALRAIAALERITALLPTQTKRTAEQDEFQQYSTVPAFAFAANWVAAIRTGETMAEFSAGIGGLAVFAKAAGARLVLNELSSRRAALLQEVFPDSKVFHENAEQIDNILPTDVRPTVVVINPPFSSSAATGKKNTTVGAQHVEQALARLEPGGRLVAIVGEGMAMDKPAFAAWWKKIAAKFNVRAAIPMDGSGYAKYGTTYDNVLLVIDKIPPGTAAPITTAAKTYTELVGLLAEVRNERPHTRTPVNDRDSTQPDPDRGGHDAPAGAGPGQPAPGPAGPGGPRGVGPGTPGGRPGLGQGGGPSGRPQGGAGPTRTPGRPGGVPGLGDGAQPGRGGPADPGVDRGPDSGGHTTGLTISGEQVQHGELTDSVFETYTPQRLQVPGAKAHPGALVQSAAMASVLPPAPTYTPNLPRSTIEGGLLSIAQIEAVVYAGQAHGQVLDVRSDRGTLHAMGLDNKGVAADLPYRRGFFIGDGTGVGKGREISGILLDNLRQGRTKHVWISEKQPLMNDAARDFAGVQEGVTADSVLTGNRIFNLSKKTEADTWRVTADDGILYTTYSTLRSAQKFGSFEKGDEVELKDGRTGELVAVNKNKQTASVKLPGLKKNQTVAFADIESIDNDTQWQTTLAAKPPAGWIPRTRLDQIVEWLGKDFDGVIAFDEVHNAGNAIAMKGERGTTDPSAQALAVVALQNRLPNARIVYVSATGATEVSNLAFATRLGLWGSGTSFPSVHNFIAEMTAGGLATMELVARDLKQAGSYMARSLSFDGVTYARLEHDLTPLQREIYNRLAEAWQVTLQNFMAALEATGVVNQNGVTKNSRALANAKSAYWGAQQRFFNQIITSMQMPSVIEGIERDLAGGKAVVLQLVNTNEAQQERSLAAKKEAGEEDLEDLDLTPRDQLMQMVEKAFPVQQYEDVVDPSTGRTTSQPVLDGEGKPVLNRQAVALRDKLLKDLADIKVPDGPLELILNTFGPDVVAEVTGRKQRVVRKPDAEGTVRAQIEKRGDAAVRADADAFMADKKQVLVFSDAGGTGFSFHADLTKKNQRKRAHYLIQPGWRANKAVQGLGRTHRTNQASAPHYTLASTDIPAHKRFLSSIARRLDQLGALTKGQRDTSSGGLFTEKDNLESKYATQAARRLLDDARLGQIEGLKFDEFLKQMGLEDIVNPATGQIAESAYPPTRQFLNRMLSLTLEVQETVFNAFIARMEEAVELAAQRGELDTGMQTIRALSTTIAREETVHVDERTGAETKYVELALTQPTRMYGFPTEAAQGGKIEWVTNVKSGRVWGKVRSGNVTKRDGSVVERYRMLGTGGTQIKEGGEFTTLLGGREVPTGAYATIPEEQARALWDKETAARPQTYDEKAHMIVGAMLPIWDRLKTDGLLQVARTQTTDGQRLLGRLIHPKDVSDLLRRLDLASAESRLTPEEVFARLMKGEVAELANRWHLERARVSDDLRIEIKASLYGAIANELVALGVVREKIQWNERYFIPDATVLGKLLKNKPVVSLTNPNAAKDDAPAPGPAAAPAASPEAAGEARAKAAGLPVIEHTVQKTGKIIRGVITRHLTEAQARTINDFVWKKDGGIFFRLSDLAKVLDKFPLRPAAGGVLGTSLIRVFDNFAGLGTRFGTARQGMQDAESKLNIRLGLTPVRDDSLGAFTPAAVDLASGTVLYNPTDRVLTRSEWAQSMAEEILHVVDLVGPNTAMSVTSKRLAIGSGDIALEAQAVFDSGKGLADYLSYPFDDALYGFTPERKQAELFARLGVLYHGDQALMQRELPIAYDAYHVLFAKTRLGPESSVLADVRRADPGRSGSGRGAVSQDGRADGSGRAGDPRQAADHGLDALRARIARIFDADPTGGLVDGGRLEAGPTLTPRRSAWLDPTNRLQFAPGEWLYRALDKAASPLLSKLGLRAMRPELRHQLRQMKLAVQRAQDTAVTVSKEMHAFSADERAMVSDIVEQELAAGVTPPAHAIAIAALMSQTMTEQSEQLVALGMLSREAAARWDGKYLPRFYKSKLRHQVDAWADALRRLRGRTSVMKGIQGNHLKMRGALKTILAAELPDFEALGWEVRDPGYVPGESKEVQVWRDWTREEREARGEIRDANFRFVMGYMQTQRDLALGTMFAAMAADPTQSSRLKPEGQDWVQVPRTVVEGTGVTRYGKLSGRYVPRETLSHLSQIEEASSALLQTYRKGMGVWKEGKTALNPVSHVNNTVGNVIMAHLAGVGLHRADKYVAALKDFMWKAPGIKEARDAGLFLGSMNDAELMDSLPKELRDLVARSSSTTARGAKLVFNLLTLGLRRPLLAAYGAEDTFFRYLLYKDARGRGASPDDAVDYAQDFIFTYDDLPGGARKVRDFAIPFSSYTYKLIPRMLHTALTHPVRFGVAGALAWAANAAAYAIAAGDDDDDWYERLRKYATDEAYRDKVRALEDEEQKGLPPWMRGVTAMVTRKTIRLGTDKLTGLPLFIDIQRLIPGSDMNDVSPHVPGAMWLPQMVTPSNPVLTVLAGILANVDLWTGKPLVDNNDNTAESTKKRLDWAWKLASPAIAIGNTHWERSLNAAAQASGGEITWLPEFMAENYTGINKSGLPVQPAYAALQTFGIKVSPQDLAKSERMDQFGKVKLMRDIISEMARLKRQENMGALKHEVFERERDKAVEKLKRVREGLTVDGFEK